MFDEGTNQEDKRHNEYTQKFHLISQIPFVSQGVPEEREGVKTVEE